MRAHTAVATDSGHRRRAEILAATWRVVLCQIVIGAVLVTVLAVPALAGSTTHTVQRGDTLGRIAARYGTTIAALVEANDISNPNLIVVGQVLTIGSDGSGSAADSGATHTIAPGETLATIAARYGTTIAALAEANEITDPNRIIAGRTLTVPGGATSSGAEPGSPAPTAAPSGPPQGPHPVPTYIVQGGDTLSGIASRHSTSPDAVAKANGIIDHTELFATVRLLIADRVTNVPVPGGGGSGGGTYSVSSGDTLASIAARHGTTVAALVQANGIPDPNQIVIGQELQVPGGGGGAWTCPVAGAVYFNDWGFPRSGGRYHEGNDLFAPRGTPARAPVGGTATQQTGSLAGLQVTLEGDDGYTYILTHLDSFGASGRVEAGTTIGTVGSSGNAVGSSPHTHFEMHPGRVAAVNPYPTLRANC